MFMYGLRTNKFLVQNYGFVQSNNLADSFEFRVILSTKPEGKIEDVSTLLPTKKEIDDPNFEEITELQYLKPYRVNNEFMNYLRSVLLNNYEGPKKEYIMISSPRLIEYE